MNRNRDKKFRNNKIVLDTKGATFNMKLSVIIIMIFSLIIGVMQSIQYYIMTEKNDIVLNQVKLYNLAIHSWNIMFAVGCFSFQTVLWNNTVTIHNRTSLESYYDYRDRMRNELVDGYKDLSTKNFGNITAFV